VSILAFASATRINQPLSWWKSHLSENTQKGIAKSWPWIIITFVVIFFTTVSIQIFGTPFGVTITTMIVSIMALGMVLVMVLSTIVAMATEVYRRK
jgi:hypothetical protein